MPKISAIIPVYNAEKYLKRCINSVFRQNFTDWELILINDGSTDNSDMLCDEFAKSDGRIKVVHKINGGVSSARQAGLEVASGEYVIHIDPDDWIEPNMFEALYSQAIKDMADIVICDYYSESSKGLKYHSQNQDSWNHIDIFKALFRNLHGATWNKLIKLGTIRKYNVTFPKGINLCEDVYFNAELVKNNIKISYLPKAFYHYDLCTNPNSIVRKPSRDAVESLIKFTTHFLPLWEEFGLYDVITKYKVWVKKYAFYSNAFSKNELKSIYNDINSKIRKYAIHNWYSDPSYMQIWLAMKFCRMVGNIYNKGIFGIRKIINRK